jgi:CubicO group peptidase (beta-lactamase class C family)
MLRELVLMPLGIEGYIGAEPPRPPALIADIGGPHAATPLVPQNSRFWRALGLPGSSLVTTPAGALALVRAFAGVPPAFLRPATRAAATRNQVGDVAGDIGGRRLEPCPWGLGPMIRGADTGNAPAEASPDSYGHGGATGCLVWADPAADIAWAIFGTRSSTSGWKRGSGRAIAAALLATG